MSDQPVVVLGTYGLDEGGAWTGQVSARAAQAIAVVRDRTAKVNPSLLQGLPRNATGWAEGDLEVGGSFPNNVWLERTLRDPAAPNKGALFEVTHDGFTWSAPNNSWRSSAGKDSSLRGPHTTLPTAQMMCPGTANDPNVALSLLAAERAPDGTTFVAGRCEDELHRPTGPLLLSRFDVRSRRWHPIVAPPSVLFEGPEAIVNAGIVAVSPGEAWIYAYRPFNEKEQERAYLVHWTEAGSELVPVPFQRSIVSLAHLSDGSLWAVGGFAELHRMDAQRRWGPSVALPPLKFIEPVPSNVRLIDVQAAGKDVWVHGAVPIIRDDGSPGRTHVLYTTAPWSAPLHCDRAQPPQTALGPSTSKVKLAVLVHTPADPRDTRGKE